MSDWSVKREIRRRRRELIVLRKKALSGMHEKRQTENSERLQISESGNELSEKIERGRNSTNEKRGKEKIVKMVRSETEKSERG